MGTPKMIVTIAKRMSTEHPGEIWGHLTESIIQSDNSKVLIIFWLAVWSTQQNGHTSDSCEKSDFNDES